MKTPTAIFINTDFIKLDDFLKLAGIISTGGQAKLLLSAGQVKVNEEAESRRGRKLYPGDLVEIENTGWWTVTRNKIT